VPDAEAAAEWYSRVFGLRRQSAFQAPDGSVSGMVLGSDRLVVEILQHREARSLSALGADPADAHQIHGIFKVGLHGDDFD